MCEPVRVRYSVVIEENSFAPHPNSHTSLNAAKLSVSLGRTRMRPLSSG